LIAATGSAPQDRHAASTPEAVGEGLLAREKSPDNAAIRLIRARPPNQLMSDRLP
jgi:hypothetical protein